MCTWLAQCYTHFRRTEAMSRQTWPSTAQTGRAGRIFWPGFALPMDISTVCLHARPPDERRGSSRWNPGENHLQNCSCNNFRPSAMTPVRRRLPVRVKSDLRAPVPAY
ncbi:hypothetical protein BLA29_000230 [Euroglyphus maynei]|uniref:Uncharacterized protein n=1 Tax=Euroglyphus maynei TaxID=6958 RepID=A0A1Y3B0Z2_EURMA|nr:hypothetical protein BLA29_000230 [Euroglyphus maynei]